MSRPSKPWVWGSNPYWRANNQATEQVFAEWLFFVVCPCAAGGDKFFFKFAGFPPYQWCSLFDDCRCLHCAWPGRGGVSLQREWSGGAVVSKEMENLTYKSLGMFHVNGVRRVFDNRQG